MRSLAACIILFFSIATRAQIMLGIKAGLNLSSVSVDTRNIANTRSELLPGLNIGVAADFGITHYLSLKTELLFSQKGYQERRYYSADLFTKYDPTYSDSWSQTNNYLELPVLANYFYEGKRFKIFLNGGFYGAYWFSGTETATFFTNDLGGPSNTYRYKNVSSSHVFDDTYGSNKKIDTRFDFGMIGGAGFGIRIKNGWLNFEGRYNQGFIDLNTFEGSIPSSYSPQYNSNWGILVNYVLILKPAKPRLIPDKKVKPAKKKKGKAKKTEEEKEKEEEEKEEKENEENNDK